VENISFSLFSVLVLLPVSLVEDAWFLGLMTHQLSVTFRNVVSRMGYRRLMRTSPQIHALDLRCISWMLHTSLDKAVHLSTLEYLEPLLSIPTDFKPALVRTVSTPSLVVSIPTVLRCLLCSSLRRYPPRVFPHHLSSLNHGPDLKRTQGRNQALRQGSPGRYRFPWSPALPYCERHP